MFLQIKMVYFTGYADDNTPFAAADNIEDVIQPLEQIGDNLITGFSGNQMKLNPDKCYLFVNTKEQDTLKIDNLHIKISLCKKWLGINFDYKLNFAKHIEDISKKHKESWGYLQDWHHIWRHHKTYSNERFLQVAI